MPQNSSWMPSIVIWSVAFLWLLGSIIYWVKTKTHKNKELVMKDNPKQKPSIIKDTQVELEVENTDKAIGMYIDDTPSELLGVRVNVKAKDSREITGFKVTSNNCTPLSSILTMCQCGFAIRTVTTCGYKPKITCPQCGKKYDFPDKM